MSNGYSENNGPNQSNCSETPDEYLRRAADACEAGDMVLGMYLYLAAYEKAAVDPTVPDGMALSGLQEAWHLACDLKERSMAEYVFEKLEPFLMPDEIGEYAEELQNLALDRLEEFGFSREELEEVADMISRDILGGENAIMKLESFPVPNVGTAMIGRDMPVGQDRFSSPDAYAGETEDAGGESPLHEPTTAAKKRGANKMGLGVAPADDFNPYDMLEPSSVGKSYHAATNEGAGAYSFTRDLDRAAEAERAKSAASDIPEDGDVHLPDDVRPSSSDLQWPGKPGDEDGARIDRVAADLQAQLQQAISNAAQQAPDVVERLAEKQAHQGISQRPVHGGDAPLDDDSGNALANLSGQTAITGPRIDGSDEGRRPQRAQQASQPQQSQQPPKQRQSPLTYRTLVGYDEAISIMRDLGVGLNKDKSFQNFVNMLNSRHGLSRMPALDTILFRAPIIEDAVRFMEATVGEIGLPVLRMTMEDNPQGMPVLCVSTTGSNRPRMNHAQNRFEAPAILVLDDLDMWMMPQAPDALDGIGGFMAANISRGAREAVNLIRSAVDDPEVYVLATATTSGEVDPFFYELLEPMTVVDIADPTEYERNAIWAEIMGHHPSMRFLNRAELVRLSAGLARYDIYLTAREAVEEAYKLGLMQRMFVPVSPQNVYDKLAACHMPDSEAYRIIEDEIISEFRHDLDHLEDLLN